MRRRSFLGLAAGATIAPNVLFERHPIYFEEICATLLPDGTWLTDIEVMERAYYLDRLSIRATH